MGSAETGPPRSGRSRQGFHPAGRSIEKTTISTCYVGPFLLSSEQDRGSRIVVRGSLHENIEQSDIVVVGAGLYGITMARQIADILGRRVAVLDRRPHIAGNAFSEVDEQTGIEVHRYGSHLFHTSNQRVWEFVNRFTGFNGYVHHVMTTHDGVVYPLPIGLGTINSFFRTALSPDEARKLIARQAGEHDLDPDASLEASAVRQIGRPLYDAFIRGYTKKQWQVDPADLPADVIRRLPVRFTYDQRYFSDTWEGLPLCGYTELCRRMLDHELISVDLDVDYFDLASEVRNGRLIIYTGAVDRFFDFRFGPLGWRTLDFEFEHVAVNDLQGTSVMNFADEDVPYTRIHEFKHLHPERRPTPGQTVIAREYSRLATRTDEPYYPINTPADRSRAREYRDAADEVPGVVFGGRLGSYQYLDMHMAIASALSVFEKTVHPAIAAGTPLDQIRTLS